MKSELVVISYNSHDTTFVSWHIFTCHNALWLFKNSHNTQFHIVAVPLMPERVVVIFSTQCAFSIFQRNIYINTHQATDTEISIAVTGS